MNAMINQAMETPNEPVAMAIVDSAGNLLAYQTMDNLRIFSRRHALGNAHTSALMGLDSGGTAQRPHSQGHDIAGQDDPMMTHCTGGVVIMKVVIIKDGVILGGIGVGGYPWV